VPTDRRVQHPGPLIVGAFGMVIVVGAALLALPISHRGDSGVGWGDAMFTSASAVTVTGLGVVDTATAWSTFGQIVLLALIQMGGLGIMTLAGFLGIALNQRLGLRSARLVSTEIGVTHTGAVKALISDLVRFVVWSEVVISVALTLRFVIGGDSLLHSIRLGVFHAVSAFNNAGFSILGGGLERYVGDWFVNLVIAAGFIVGGLGFPVVFELRRRWRSPRQWSLHTKVTLSTSALLLGAGTVLIGLVEWSNEATFGNLGFDERILASFFQAATARTAGFNTVAISSMRPASWLVLILLMVIGAGSASTGGGIKISTFAVVVRSTLAELRGDQVTTLFDRAVPECLQRQALSLVVAALGTVGTAAFVLSISNPSIPLAELLFEAASAFGTVGTSTGVTSSLDGVGRLVVIVLMFIGRIGPITFGTAVLLRPERKRFDYAEQELLVG